jgi:hypothetical protein
MGSPCLLSRRRPSCSSISAKPTAGMKPYHRGLLQARANGEVKPSDARVGRTDHTTWPLGVWFWSMQKTHLRQTSRTHRIPPLPAPHPVYAEITCLLHTVGAMPVGGKSVLRTRSCRPHLAAIPARISCQPCVVNQRWLSHGRCSPGVRRESCRASPYGEYAHRSGVRPFIEDVDDHLLT